MENKYTEDNVEAMVDAVKSNTETINNMLLTVNENGRLINDKLSDYAVAKTSMSDENIEMYRDYSMYSQSVKDNVGEYIENMQNYGCNNILAVDINPEGSDYSFLHSVFEALNKMQVKIMEMLCSLIGKGNMLLASI